MRTLATRAEPIPLFWQHRPDMRIGWIERIAEDAKGLRVIATIDNPEGGAALALKAGKTNGLSFGYRARGYQPDAAGRELTDIDLYEVSLVSHPMQHAARVHLVEGAVEAKFNQRHYTENGRFARVGEGMLYGGNGTGGTLAQTPNRQSSNSAGYPARITIRPYPVRIKLPESKPSQPDRPAIRFPHSPGIDLPDQVVSKANTLSEAVRASTGHQIHVTSGRRQAHRQASAMYDNFVRKSVPRYLNRNAFEEVRRAYLVGLQRGLGRNQTISLMTGVLTDQTKRGIYLSRHMRSGAIDIRTPPAGVLNAIRKHPSVQSAGVEKNHIHIQFF